MRKAVLLFIAAGMLLYCAVIGTVYLFQDFLLYRPSHLHHAPAELNLARFQEAALQTPDGTRLNVWIAQPVAPEKNWIVYLHGKGGSLTERAPLLHAFAQDGDGVAAVDWRGFGASTGAPSQAGLQQDALTVYDYVRSLGVSPDRIFLFGESLGTGLAIWLAGERPVAGVVLDSPYSSIIDVAAQRFWFLPVRGLAKDSYPAEDWIHRLQKPVFAAHGEKDRSIPLPLAQSLMKSAPKGSEFIIVQNAPHIVFSRPDVLQKAKDWMKTQTPSARE